MEPLPLFSVPPEPGSHGEAEGAAPAAWDPAELAGRLVEISFQPTRATPNTSGASLTAAALLLWKAQQAGEPSAWVSALASSFYPPDLDAAGIDLAALIVVRARGGAAAARAADKLLRSGAFGFVVLDLGGEPAPPAPLLGRLLALARTHHATVVVLTVKPDDAPSLAPLVSLRVRASQRRLAPGRFACTVEALKDKRRGPGWSFEETFRGPPGLR